MNDQELLDMAKKILRTVTPTKMDSLIADLVTMPKCQRKSKLPVLFNKYADRSIMNICDFEDKVIINKLCHKCIVDTFEDSDLL